MVSKTKILVYGAGPLGSLFAARLQAGCNEVSLLARGRRLAELRQYGVVLCDAQTGETTVTYPTIVEQLAPEDVYDLVLVIMRKNHVRAILPVLAANRQCPDILFLMNNAAGPDELVEALGQERVLIGFPSSAGYFEGHVIHYLSGTEDAPSLVPFGEVDGQINDRTWRVAHIIESGVGFKANIRKDMDAWLKYHVALLMPSLGPAVYGTGIDRHRLARTRDALVLAVRAIREGFRVLRAYGLIPTPGYVRLFERFPEPVLVGLLRYMTLQGEMDIAMMGHARAARDEVIHLADEFRALARAVGIPTPHIDQLYPYLDPETPLIPDGSAEIPIRGGEWLGGLGIWVGGVTMRVMAALRQAEAKRQ